MEPIELSIVSSNKSVGSQSRVYSLASLLSSQPDQGRLGAYVKENLDFSDLLSLFCDLSQDTRGAILTGSTDATRSPSSISHADIYNFICNSFDIGRFGIRANDRVGVLLPDGPALGLCIMSTMTYCCCAPMNPNSTIDELRTDLARIRAVGKTCRPSATFRSHI